MRISDPQTDVAPSKTRGRNVRSKNQCSMCPAIHTKSRSWLRSSSTREPSDPLLRVVFWVFFRNSGISPSAPMRSRYFRESHLSRRGEKPSRSDSSPGPAALSRTAETSKLGSETGGVLRRRRRGGPPLFEPGTLASTPCAEVAAGNRHLTNSRKCVRTADCC